MGKWLLGKPSWPEDSRNYLLCFAVFERNGRVFERVESGRDGFMAGLGSLGSVVLGLGGVKQRKEGLKTDMDYKEERPEKQSETLWT